MRTCNFIFPCLLILTLTALTAGCVASKQTQQTSLSVDEMIRIAKVEDPKAVEKIKQYFSSMRKNKAFSLDPFNNTRYHWAYGYYKKELAIEKVAADRAKILFTVNKEFVWEESLTAYQASPMGKGRQFYEDGDYDSAITQFQLDIELMGPNWYTYNRLGWACLNAGMYLKSITNFTNSLQLKSDDFSRVGLAEAYLVSGEADLALSELKKISSNLSNSESNYAKHLLAMTYIANEEYLLAAKTIRQPTIGLHFSSTNKGMRIITAYPKSPATLAGLVRGDIILSFNKIPLANKESGYLGRLVANTKPGTISKITFERDGKKYQSEIITTLSETLKTDSAKLKIVQPIVQ